MDIPDSTYIVASSSVRNLLAVITMLKEDFRPAFDGSLSELLIRK